MGVFSKIFASMVSQNSIGWAVIVLIVMLFIVGLVSSVIIKKYYKSLKNEFTSVIDDGGYFEDNELSNIIDEFSKSTMAGTDNINTEVIIDRHLNNRVLKLQSISKIIPATLIGLGLLGTFLGLTLAIFETKGALNGIENINTFSVALQSPIASMATAFWTSIFGVIGSIILNFNNQSIGYYKLQFYTEIENYLDNEVFCKRAKTFNTIFEEFSVTVKTTMLTLTKEMTILFKNGVEELVNKINSNSIDLTNSAEALKDYTEKFRELVGEMDNTVKNFNEPVDKFNNSVKDFVVISEGLEKSFNDNFSHFNNSVNNLDNSMLLLAGNMDSSFREMGEIINNSSKMLTSNIKENSSNVINSLEHSLTDFTENIKESGENIAYSMDKTLVKFSGEITESIDNTGETFKESMSEVAVDMNKSFNNLDELLNENIDGLNNLIMTIKDEGALTERRAITLNGLISTINSINEIRDNESAEQMDMLREAYAEFKEVVSEFNSSFSDINSAIAEELEKALNQRLNEIGKEFSRNLAGDISLVVKEISDSAENLNESVSIVGELVKASNDWASAVAYSLNEVGSEKLR